MPPPTNKAHRLKAFSYWKEWLNPSDTVIDATCGNGKDTLVLAELVPKGKVISLDIQEIALERARLLTAHLHNISFCLQSHENLSFEPPIKLIVYNLGYLPGGDKTLTTSTETTLKSLKAALHLTRKGGAISLTCYPGHPEGKRELEAIQAYLAALSSHWECPFKITLYEWEETKPVFIWIQS